MAEQILRPLRAGEVRLRVHGRRDGSGERVPASVFAQKLAILVTALRAADAAVNGKTVHDYVISGLRHGSALVELREEEISRFDLLEKYSGVSAFDECVEAIREGSIQTARNFGKCPIYVSRLAKGSGQRFAYAELWIGHDRLFRVDDFLLEQTEVVIEGSKIPSSSDSGQHWYKGIVHGTFEGVVKEVDLRGALPEVKLILTAGGKELDCIFRDIEIERIRQALDRRARVQGTAYYDGKSGLPRRVEVTVITPVKEPGDFTRWKGTFEPFTAPEWENDFDPE
jgi:hypothetical protein